VHPEDEKFVQHFNRKKLKERDNLEEQSKDGDKILHQILGHIKGVGFDLLSDNMIQ
jgi:hypothetical protein